jgi:uncharacterized protein YggE
MTLTRNLFLVAVAGALCSQAAAQMPQADNTVTVTGTATTQVKPDFASVEIEAFYKSTSVAGAKKKCDAAMAKAIAAIRKLGVQADGITTTGYAIFPIKGGETMPVTWKVSESASIKIRKLDMVADIIDAAVTNGAPVISGVQFGLDAVGPARDQVRALAMKTAADKAAALAKLGGVELGQVLSISETGDYGFAGQWAYANSYVDNGYSPASINAGQRTVSLTVTVVYRIKQRSE